MGHYTKLNEANHNIRKQTKLRSVSPLWFVGAKTIDTTYHGYKRSSQVNYVLIMKYIRIYLDFKVR